MLYYYVYILECSDGTFYTGISNNVSRRFIEHQKGINIDCYTYFRRPVKLVFQQDFMDVEQAIYFEKKIKKWSHSKKKALANENWELLPRLSECKNRTHCKNKKKD